ncbi:DUF2917 domain-containing protein [Dechloromonas sp. A34]|uniref:DUF2917 domain-containing protein n=1 Tax=Dechloromonas sp. A34 TaxID=447588 RepID=UPI0022491BFA|nr:DUF2917 domain-containing protein [Dechloromonas sp. A34]
MFPILQAANTTPLYVQLQRRETLVVTGTGRLVCEAGEVWLTESGSPEDSILQAGDQWPLRPGIEVALSTLAGARLCFCTTAGSRA